MVRFTPVAIFLILLASLLFSVCQPVQTPAPADENTAAPQTTSTETEAESVQAADDTAEGEAESGWPIMLIEDPSDEDALYAGIDLDMDAWLDCSTQNGFDLDAEGNLLVVDAANNQVRVFDPDGQAVTRWGQPGDGPGEFNFKHSKVTCSYGDLAIGPNGSIYVLEMGNLRVQKFDAAGKFLLEWGGKGFHEGQFVGPIDIEVNSRDEVFVTDEIRSDIQKFDPQGNFLLRLGGAGSDDGRFSKPYRMAIDDEDNLYVADMNTHRIQKFDADGAFLAAWQTLQPDEVANCPSGVGVDGEGNVYIASMTNSYLRAFDPEGVITGTWGEVGIEPGQFYYPYYVVASDEGRLYVGDLGGARIQKLAQP